MFRPPNCSEEWPQNFWPKFVHMGLRQTRGRVWWRSAKWLLRLSGQKRTTETSAAKHYRPERPATAGGHNKMQRLPLAWSATGESLIVIWRYSFPAMMSSIGWTYSRVILYTRLALWCTDARIARHLGTSPTISPQLACWLRLRSANRHQLIVPDVTVQ